MAKLKSDDDIKRMRASGLLVWEAHQVAARLVEPGVPTREIDAAVEDFILSKNATPMFKGVPGAVPYPASTCISINEAIVHGIPSERRLEEGDIVSIDIGVKLNGWCGDAAVTHAVGAIDEEAQRLLDVTENTLRIAIDQVGRQKNWRKVARKMQGYVESEGFSVVRALVGHAIGREMWEKPQVPNYYDARAGFRLRPGMVLAIEPMVNVGTYEVEVLSDHWTIVTEDGKRSAHFEHTVALTSDGPEILTASPEGTGWALD